MRWTDADGTTQCVELGGDPKFSLIGLRELLKLVDALGGRRFPSNDEWRGERGRQEQASVANSR